MNRETVVKYSFTVLDEYQDLEDGTPNFHHSPAIRISNQGTIEQFLDSMQKNSKVKGLSIVDIDFEIINS
jgi:hypothetical protein